MKSNNTVEEYISNFPAEAREMLKQVRETVRSACPQAEETISYGMPAYKVYGRALVYFGGFRKHIGFYATPNGHKKFERELSKYKQGKGSVQFPYDLPMPLDLIRRIVEFRTEENRLKAKKK